MASTRASSSSSSASVPRWKYDVFLSFRGEDTQGNFTDHLYTALTERGIHTFRDDEEIERGGEIAPKLLKAIEESRFCVVVFSKGYAHSTWCLDELAKIIECVKENGQTIIPIFYHADPSDVQKQRGSFEEAFVNLEKQKEEKAKRWRAALREASNISGWHLEHG